MDVRVTVMDFPTYRKYIEQVAAKSGPIGADVEFIHKLPTKVSKKFRQTSEYLDTLKMAKKDSFRP